jgi:glutaminyl-peptide cyclotransferase
MRKLIAFTLCVMILCLASCGPERNEPPPQPPAPPARTTPVMHYSVVKKYPHDVTAFTEGFLFHDGVLYESTGAPEHLAQTRSSFGIVDLNTGKLQIKAELDKNVYFGEGIVILNDKIYQVTWRNQTGFIYDLKSFRKLGQFSYVNKEGWGLTTDGKHLIMSDGTFNLTWLDPSNFTVARTLAVTKEGFAVDHVNELELIDGFIYANIWMTNFIIKIDPATGEVLAQADLTDLFNECRAAYPQLGEMNGIAYNHATKQIFVTGKMWPFMYEIKFS